MPAIIELPISSWSPAHAPGMQARALRALEDGNVLLLPALAFALDAQELPLLAGPSGSAKNISWNATRGLHGQAPGHDATLLRNLMRRYAARSRSLLDTLLPSYRGQLHQGNTSFRPVEIDGRRTSWRHDDTRLHVDSFPATPTRGQRILRVFTNIHPGQAERVWRLGSPFEDVAYRYAQPTPHWLTLASTLLLWTGLTKSRRSPYDQCMLQIHDTMKADAAYQAAPGHTGHRFRPGQTWIAYTDQVTHAATRGQHALEQTFLLPVAAMATPEQSPLAVLERVLGRPLV